MGGKCTSGNFNSDQVYKFIFESSLDAILLTSPDGSILAANPAAEILLGYSQEELGELGRDGIVDTSDPKLPILLEERRRKGEVKGELTFIRKNGEKFPSFISSHIFQDEKGNERTSMTIIDLTEIKKAEMNLKESEERYSITLEAVNDGLWDWNVPSGDAFFSPNYYKLLGYDPGEFPANYKSWRLLVHPEDVDSVEKQLEESVKSGIGFEIDLRMKTKSQNWLWVSTRGKAIEIDSTGNATRMVGTLSDIGERKNAEEELQKMASIVENSDDAIVGKDLEGTVLSWNKAAESIYGYSAEEIIGKPISLLIPSNSNEMSQFLEKIRNGEKIRHYRTKRIHKNGEIIEVSLTISPMKDSQGNVIGASSISRDITERVKMEDAIKTSERKYRNIFENVQDIFYQTNPEGIITEISPSIERYSGYKPDELIGKPVEMVYLNPEDRKELLKAIGEKGEIVDYEVQLKSKTHDLIYVSTNAHFMFDSHNRPIGIEGSLRDITERKNMELELEKSLEEKDMLLKEIHHRVKNNLMVISSLLNLQSRYIKDKEALGIFKESQSRARSMALIHERLYQSSDLKRINFGDYIRTLAIDLFHTYGSNDGRLKLNMNVDDLMLDINTTVPLGLIVNELVSNCMKHAFPDDMSGEIKIDFHKNGEEYLLKVSDNGKGFPEDLDFQNTQSLGLQLVNSLTGQIDGEIILDRSQGTVFTINFQEKKYD